MREAKADERIRVVGKVPSGLPNLTFPAARQMKSRKPREPPLHEPDARSLDVPAVR